MGRRIKLKVMLEHIAKSDNKATAANAQLILDTGNVELVKNMGGFMNAICSGDLARAVQIADFQNKVVLMAALKEAEYIPDEMVLKEYQRN